MNIKALDHTADVAFEITADSPEELIKEATKAFYSVIGELKTKETNLEETTELSLTGQSRAFLLRDYLSELLYLFEVKNIILLNVRCLSFTETELKVAGEKGFVDSKKSVYYKEVKAVTYHNLEVVQ
ncbi:MAG: archease, partial [Candidatus Dadabacteria bacterium]